MDSLAFLQNVPKLQPQSLYVLHGDEDFLKRQVVKALRRMVLQSEEDSFGLSSYAGNAAQWATVHDELHTLPFLGTRRLLVVEDGDPFVSLYRGQLEKLAANPCPSGVLVLVVKAWPSTTRLAKLLDTQATIECKTPPSYKLPEWCTQHAAAAYGKQLSAAAARLLVDLVGPEMGQLDQELGKLAVYTRDNKEISEQDVDRLVGSSRSQSMWKIFDAIGAGQGGEALGILDRLLEQGEEPIRILGAFSMQLRRLAQVARLAEQGQSVRQAMETAGVPVFGQRGVEQQLRHLGRARSNQLYDWLLETDLGLKGSSPLPPRTLLERLVVQLSK